jgi:hypothetical protein
MRKRTREIINVFLTVPTDDWAHHPDEEYELPYEAKEIAQRAYQLYKQYGRGDIEFWYNRMWVGEIEVSDRGPQSAPITPKKIEESLLHGYRRFFGIPDPKKETSSSA